MTHTNASQSGSHTYSYTSSTNKVSSITSSISRNGSSSLSFGYDANGNVNSLSGLDYSINSVSYDWRNLPLSMNAGGSRTYRYDHAGARVYKSYEGVHYLRGAYGEILAVYEGGSLAYWNILRPDGTPIGRRESGGTLRYYHRDHLGSTRAVVTADSVTEAYDFMPFGMEMDRSKTGSGPTRNKFTGHETDEENQLVHMEWRGYLAEFGRFLSVDPHAENYPSLSPYVYAANNPLIFIDPDGRDITIKYNCNDDKCEEWVFTGDNAEAGREIGNEFINQFLDAYEYVTGNGGSENLMEAATNRDLQIGLRQFNEENAQYHTGSYHLYGTVYWLPEGGLRTDNGSVASPATVLEHEFTHAVEYSKDPMGFSRRSKADREASAIRAEIRVARKNEEIGSGHMLRSPYDHRNGHTVGTFGPTSNRIDRQKTYQYYSWLNQNTSFDVSKFLKLYGGLR